MDAVKKMFYRRLAKEEHKELQKILIQENKALLRRPQYVVGNIIAIAMIFYFMVRGFGVEDFRSLNVSTGNIVGAVAGALVGGIVFLLLSLKFNKMRFYAAIWGSVFWTLWMSLFLLIVPNHSEKTYNWTYFVYMGLMFIGWGCCNDSIKMHFCERIFMSQKEKQGQFLGKQ